MNLLLYACNQNSDAVMQWEYPFELTAQRHRMLDRLHKISYDFPLVILLHWTTMAARALLPASVFGAFIKSPKTLRQLWRLTVYGSIFPTDHQRDSVIVVSIS
jgi:hypothetical protein